MITDFLETTRSKEELATTLSVVREFKSHESEHEWVSIPIVAWAKLEQLEEYLAYLVEGAPLEQDTIDFIKRTAR